MSCLEVVGRLRGSSEKGSLAFVVCALVATWTCRTVFATSKGCARRTEVYFHIACSARPLSVSVGEGESEI